MQQFLTLDYRIIHDFTGLLKICKEFTRAIELSLKTDLKLENHKSDINREFFLGSAIIEQCLKLTIMNNTVGVI